MAYSWKRCETQEQWMTNIQQLSKLPERTETKHGSKDPKTIHAETTLLYGSISGQLEIRMPPSSRHKETGNQSTSKKENSQISNTAIKVYQKYMQ